MEQVVLLSSGKEITFYHVSADFNAKHFVEELLNRYSFDRCQCLLVEPKAVKEGDVPGCLKAPGTSPSFLQQNVTS